jgi:cyclophilin family peptidyl-prolyl cis-trans isomerase
MLRMWRASWFPLTCVIGFSAACQTALAQSPVAQPVDAAVRAQIARAELAREAGIDPLLEILSQGSTSERVLALRGLGRIGAPTNAVASPVRSRSIESMIAALQDPAPEVVAAAAAALGLVASIDGVELGVDAELTGALERAGAGATSVLEALGVAGGAATQPPLVAALAHDATARVAALALARHGRRGLALSAQARTALVEATKHEDDVVRYAAVHALSREFEPPEDAAVREALTIRLGDHAPDVSAQAISALNRRKLLASDAVRQGRPEWLLYDADYRLVVEAVRALAATPETKPEVSTALVAHFATVIQNPERAALIQAVIEGERAIAATPLTEAEQNALSRLAAMAQQAQNLPALSRGWVECLAYQGLARVATDPDFAELQGCGLPDEWRLPLVAELIDAGVGALDARRAALAALLAHRDPRVRSAGVGVLGALAKSGEDEDRSYAKQQLVAALGAPDLMVVASAATAAAAVYEALAADAHVPINTALLERAAREQDPEVGAALLTLIGERKLADGAGSCRNALTGNPVLAAAAAGCLKALGETIAERAASAALPTLPEDIQIEQVIGKNLRWHLTTTRGEIVIGLRPDVAPWTVATIVALTQRGSYNGIAFHRVVPNFVVQGGDPTESGYGGPGFAIPLEPATVADSSGFARGGVGVADAGRDSGGSQYFIMQGPAPHLDGRYSWFGTVLEGQDAADALLIGDEVTEARIQ